MRTMNNSSKERGTALEARELVRYFGKLLAVDHLSLEVRRGEIFGFLGPNGAGKTTSIRMMCGLLKPSSGEVWINGSKMDAEGGIPVRTRVGICPQENILWNKLTCHEQLVFSARMYNVPGDVAMKRADMLLSKMGLAEKRKKLASTLSGGMKRRLNVILTIMHDPEMMVFDEPEAGLDPQSRILVREFIREIARDRTVIFTTHNMDEAERIADRVAIIDSGRLLLLDTPLNLKKSIGEGDNLELEVETGDPANLEKARSALDRKGFVVSREGFTFHIRAMDLIPRIHAIYQILEKERVNVKAMRMRENTLEDVFIHLTGKTLRS